MSNNWYSAQTSGDESWFTSEWSSGVEQDATCTYQVSSWSSDSDTYNWFIPRDGLVNSWFALERTAEVLDSVTQDSAAVSYDVGFSVYSTSPTVGYNIESTLGFILGGGDLPYGSAERDFTDTYTVFSYITAQRDFTDTYRVIGYADNVSPSVYYDVLNTVTSDGIVTYELAGYTQVDSPTASYDVVASVEQDGELSYRVVNSATQDSPENTYDIVTVPLSAGNSAVLTYQVWQSVTSEKAILYHILSAVERDASSAYAIKQGTERDFTDVWQVRSVAVQDTSVFYQVFAPQIAERTQTVQYNVKALSNQVPNVIGLPLGKAKKKLEDAGFTLGQVTYL